MERKSVAKLTNWKRSNYRMPLLITGARQIGKTHTILEFGKKEYRNMLNINFELNKSFKEIFEQNLKPQRILREISVQTGETILPNETLLLSSFANPTFYNEYFDFIGLRAFLLGKRGKSRT